MTTEALQWALVITALVATGLLTLLVVGLLRSYAEIVKALHDAGIRLEGDHEHTNGQATLSLSQRPSSSSSESLARPVSGETLEGSERAITVTGAEDHLLLAFLSSGCGSCMTFWRELRANEGQIPGLDAAVVVVTKGPEREEPGKLAELSEGRVEVLMSDESWAEYDVPLTPHFVLVDRSSGRILGEGSSADTESLAQLMGRAAADARNVTRRELLTRRPEKDGA